MRCVMKVFPFLSVVLVFFKEYANDRSRRKLVESVVTTRIDSIRGVKVDEFIDGKTPFIQMDIRAMEEKSDTTSNRNAMNGKAEMTFVRSKKGLKKELTRMKSLEERLKLPALIVGGREAKQRRYAYQAGLFYAPRYPEISYPFCGGTLIAPSVVLTAAHCVRVNGITNHPWDLFIQIGRHNYDEPTETYESFGIKEIRVNQKFNETTLDHDFALIRLRGRSSFPIVKLNSDPRIPGAGRSLTAIGWGRTSLGGNRPDPVILQEVNVNYVDTMVCNNIYEVFGPLFKITRTMICAEGNGRNTCQGDSGGPILILGKGGEQDLQVGITSWGIGCGEPDNPTVYARLSAGQNWIQKSLCTLTNSKRKCASDRVMKRRMATEATEEQEGNRTWTADQD